MSKRNEDSRFKGDIAEKLFELECAKRKIPLFKPVNSGSRIDYIMQFGTELKRVQVKYVSLINGKIVISFIKNQNGRKTDNGNRYCLKYSEDEIDCYYVYCPDTNQWYDIPMKLARTKSGIILRVGTPKIKIKTINYAVDYLLW